MCTVWSICGFYYNCSATMARNLVSSKIQATEQANKLYRFSFQMQQNFKGSDTSNHRKMNVINEWYCNKMFHI